MEYEQLTDKVKVLARGISDTLEPNEDWAPTLFLHNRDGLHMVEFDGNFLASEGDKNKLRLAIEQTIEQVDAEQAVFVCSAWTREVKTDELEKRADGPVQYYALPEGKSIEDYPIKDEIVSLIATDLDHIEVFNAKVVRSDERAPELSDWQTVNPAPGGLFEEALAEGLRRVAEKNTTTTPEGEE